MNQNKARAIRIGVCGVGEPKERKYFSREVKPNRNSQFGADSLIITADPERRLYQKKKKEYKQRNHKVPRWVLVPRAPYKKPECWRDQKPETK